MSGPSYDCGSIIIALLSIYLDCIDPCCRRVIIICSWYLSWLGSHSSYIYRLDSQLIYYLFAQAADAHKLYVIGSGPGCGCRPIIIPSEHNWNAHYFKTTFIIFYSQSKCYVMAHAVQLYFLRSGQGLWWLQTDSISLEPHWNYCFHTACSACIISFLFISFLCW